VTDEREKQLRESVNGWYAAYVLERERADKLERESKTADIEMQRLEGRVESLVRERDELAANFKRNLRLGTEEVRRERDEARAEIRRLREGWDGWQRQALAAEQERDEWKLEAERRGLPKELMQRLHRAERERGEAQEALRHYADQDNWEDTTLGPESNTAGYLSFEYAGGHELPWAVARAALAAPVAPEGEAR
jgi:hypothetical protein